VPALACVLVLGQGLMDFPAAPSGPPPKFPNEVPEAEALAVSALRSHRSSISNSAPSSAKSSMKQNAFGRLLEELQSLKEKLQHAHEHELFQLRSEASMGKMGSTEQLVPPKKEVVRARSVSYGDAPSREDPASREVELPVTLQSSDGRASDGKLSKTNSARSRTVTGQLMQSAKRISSDLADRAQEAFDSEEDGRQFELRKEFDLDNQKLLKLKKKQLMSPGRPGPLGLDGTQTLQLEDRPERRFFHEGQAMEKERPNRCIVRPSSRARMCWDVLALTFMTYDLFIIPASVFHWEQSMKDFVHAAQIVSTAYWLLDIPASFLTAVYVNNTLLTKPSDIAKEYLKTWFFFDVFIVIPDVWSLSFSDDAATAEVVGDMGVVRALRAGRIVRLIRFLRLLRMFKILKVLRTMIDRVNNAIVLLALRMIKYGLLTLYLIHVLACLWFAFGDVEGGWVSQEGLHLAPSILQYMRSVECALSRLHPSAMQSNMELHTGAERGLAIFASFLSLGLGSFFISSITNTMADIERRRQRKKQLLQSVHEYCSSHNISVTHAMRIKSYVEREHSRKKTLQAHLEFLETLPPEMLRELFHEARSRTLQYNMFFDEIGRRDPSMEIDLCNKALSEHYIIANDKIFKSEEVALNMYMIATGSCRYHFDPSTGSSKVTPALRSAPQQRRGSVGGTAAAAFFNVLANKRRVSEVSKFEGIIHRRAITLGPGDALSEHALWIEGWTHRGSCTAGMEGWLIHMSAQSLASVGADHPCTMVELVLYANKFVDSINEQFESGRCVADILYTEGSEDEGLASNKLPPISRSFRPVDPAEEAFAAT